jgi:hypothetical protein
MLERLAHISFLLDKPLQSVSAKGWMTKLGQIIKYIRKQQTANKAGTLPDTLGGISEHGETEINCEACSHQVTSTVARPHYDSALHWFWQSNLNLHVWTPDLYSTFSHTIRITRILKYKKLISSCQHDLRRYLQFDFEVEVSGSFICPLT